eukprot:gnl/TRDRNA2_/TRDRNA2_69825_c0_seq1.p1 gnl/TRDRNA2_/TRDRNA2_69825_c0~~gnl/TRDRNA2_/TRDRNA2_69825_c0_seq1.p1  ORF type:complete len:274 (+),score=36.41 gnl/TRDRNA2_/TRDRNA2_69825_c0_seq1:2-823(+)
MSSAEGPKWIDDKQKEARQVVNRMITLWGRDALKSGTGVIDVAGDPGFVSVELLKWGIPVTLVDPAFGFSGKQNNETQRLLACFREVPFTLIRKPFDQSFVEAPENQNLLMNASAIVSLRPDGLTTFIVSYSACFSMRTLIMPCNECENYFPDHDKTYNGFVRQLLVDDEGYVDNFGTTAMLRQMQLLRSPAGCDCILIRYPGLKGDEEQAKMRRAKKRSHVEDNLKEHQLVQTHTGLISAFPTVVMCFFASSLIACAICRIQEDVSVATMTV